MHMKNVCSVLLVLGLLTGCEVKTQATKAKSSVSSSASSQSLTWQQIHEASCDYVATVKQGTKQSSNNGQMYYCTDLSNASVHVRIRMFDDGSFYRQDPGQSEQIFTHSSDLDPCYFNLQQSGVTKYDFSEIVSNGAREMTGYTEFKISNSSTTNWSCVLTTDAVL